MFEVGGDCNNVMSVQNFVKIGQVLKTLKRGVTEMQEECYCRLLYCLKKMN
jgi:hypothetical protein